MKRLLVAAALVLTAVMAWDGVTNFDDQLGIDFYHLWGVGVAHARVGGNPYADTQAYAASLNAIAAGGSTRLKAVNAYRKRIEPTGTPLFYAVFSLLPADYDTAYGLFVTAQFAAWLLAAIVLARLRGGSAWAGLAAGAFLAMAFNPFVQDVKFGNVNVFQLIALVGVLTLLLRAGPGSTTTGDLAALPIVALLVVFKPNLLLMLPAVALTHALNRGVRRAALAAALCVPVIAIAWAVPVAYFRDAAIWSDWLSYTRGMNGGTLLYPAHEGNQSIAKLLAEMSHTIGPAAYGVLLAAALAFLLFAAMTSLGKRIAGFGARLRGVAADPWAAMSLAILFTFISAPLLWPHYEAWALLVLGWLFWRDRRPDAATGWCLVAVVLLSRPLLSMLYDAHAGAAIEVVLRLGWLPLVAAAAAHLARR
jgi:hypothetical protein